MPLRGAHLQPERSSSHPLQTAPPLLLPPPGRWPTPDTRTTWCCAGWPLRGRTPSERWMLVRRSRQQLPRCGGWRFGEVGRLPAAARGAAGMLVCSRVQNPPCTTSVPAPHRWRPGWGRSSCSSGWSRPTPQRRSSCSGCAAGSPLAAPATAARTTAAPTWAAAACCCGPEAARGERHRHASAPLARLYHL